MRVSTAGDAQTRLEAALAAMANRIDLTAASTAKQGAYLDLTYRIRLRPRVVAPTVVCELDQLAGVENVEIKRND